LFFVNDHQYHQLQLPLKQLFVDWLLYQFHHDQSSLNVSQLLQHDHVTSSLNDGFNMDLLLNDEPLFNVLVLLKHTQLHAMLSSNTNKLQLVLFVNSNALVLFKPVQLLMFNNMVLNFLMLLHFFHKLVLLVSLKILQPVVSLVTPLLSLAKKQ